MISPQHHPKTCYGPPGSGALTVVVAPVIPGITVVTTVPGVILARFLLPFGLPLGLLIAWPFTAPSIAAAPFALVIVEEPATAAVAGATVAAVAVAVVNDDEDDVSAEESRLPSAEVEKWP